MLKKYFLAFSFILGIAFNISAQKLLQEEAQTVKENVVKKSQSITSIISNFKQYKHLDFLSKDIISEGNLLFKAPDLIKWAYKTPFKYSVIFKNDQLLIDDDGTKSEIDLSANKAFKQLNELIIRSVKGDMFDETQFDISYFKNENYSVKFIPIDKNLKSFIDSFEIIFDNITFDVLSIKMLENDTDYTLIEFSNQKFNNPVPHEVFIN